MQYPSRNTNAVPDSQLGDGLHVVARPAPEKGAVHVGILDAATGIVYEVKPGTGLQASALDSHEGWLVTERIDDYAGALGRLRAIWSAGRQRYDALFNNCEHFVTYVATGHRQSPQLADRTFTLLLVLAAALVAAPVARRSGG
jgi:hypothetical protein